MKRIEYAKNINIYLNDYIKLADLKAGTIFTVNGAVMGIIYSQIKIETFCLSLNWNIIFIIFIFIIYALSLAISITCILSIIPRVEKTRNISLNSFPDIAKINCNNYIEIFKSSRLNEEEIAKNYSTHNWLLSNLLLKKMKLIKSSFICLIILLSFCFILFFLYSIYKLRYL